MSYQSDHVRDDLIDLTRFSHWEIKPLLSAPQGVAQESYNRLTYNTWSLFQTYALGRQVKVPRFEALDPWDPLWPFLTRPFAVAGGTAVAYPFDLDILPGLIPYAVCRTMSREEIVAIASAILVAYMAWKNQQAQRFRGLGEAVARAFEELNKLGEAVANAFLTFMLATGGGAGGRATPWWTSR